MNLWVWVKRVFKLLSLLFSALLLAFVAVNWHDEAPTPLALEMGKTAREHLSNTVPDQDNAYLYMVGFAAPEGVDPVQEGRRLVTAHNTIVERQLSGEYDFAFESPDLRQMPVLEFKGSVKKEEKCQREDVPASANRFNLSDADIAHNQQLLKDNAELVRRYHDLQRLPSYHNVSEPSLLFLLNFDPVTETRRILQKAAQTDIQQGNFAAALLFIEHDINFWRTVLVVSADLIESTIAQRNIENYLQMLAAMLGNPQFEATIYAATLRQILQPLRPLEYDLSAFFRREFLSNKYYWAMSLKPADTSLDLVWFFWGKFFLHLQAMENRSAAQTDARIQLAALSPSQFKQEQIVYQQKIAAQERHFLNPLSFEWFYDSAGKIITSMQYDYSSYIARIFDKAAYLNLVRAQLELRLNPQANGQEAAFLNAHRDWNNPYTEAPFDWDASTRSLSFIGLATRGKEAALPEFRVFLP